MTPSPRTILILGGTPEAYALAQRLVTEQGDQRRIITSRAGVTRARSTIAGEERLGGFGGLEGFRNYLLREKIDFVVDGTHPFAERMTETAFSVCRDLGIGHCLLQRPEWEATEGDNWISCKNLQDAAQKLAALEQPQTVLLTTGQKELPLFCQNPKHSVLARMIEAPDFSEESKPGNLSVLLSRGPFDEHSELSLLQSAGITLIVTKNAGGEGTTGKLKAARTLDLPVLMIDRPALPPASRVFRTAESVEIG